MATLTPRLLASIAARFKVLAEPARLRVLDALRRGPCHVTRLVAATGLQQANLSRHLQQLYAHGFVVRSRRGTFVHYAVADPRVFALCDLMCGQLKRVERLRRLDAPASRPSAGRAGAGLAGPGRSGDRRPPAIRLRAAR